MKKMLYYLALPFLYLVGVAILIYYLPDLIRDLREEERRLSRYYR